jgi:ABC-type glycerol-3-phosphate transport system substrate-binding protein
MDASSDWTANQPVEGDDAETANSKAINREVSQAKWDLVKKLEDKYNCDYEWVNLTFDGTQESLNTSVLAGSPDCDIYMVQSSMAIPAQSNGLLVDLKTILPADHDLFTDQKVFSYLDLGDGKACILQVNGNFSNTYPIGFNVQMLKDNNLEDPRDLYERGEWTWDKFIEYCQKLTQDTDGDGKTDQYGYCGYAGETLSELLMSNGTNIAGGKDCNLTSAPVGECLQMMQDMYNKYNVCYPYDYSADGGKPSDSMRRQYNQGNIAFFPAAVWIMNDCGNYPEGKEGNLTWDVAFVRWPVGPSGNKATNGGYKANNANFFVIPVGGKEPEKIFNFLYDLYNWFDGDTSKRDNPALLNWWYNETAKVKEINDANFEVQKDCLSHPNFELYEDLGVSYDLESIINGSMTPAQFQETYKQSFQDALDAIFK